MSRGHVWSGRAVVRRHALVGTALLVALCLQSCRVPGHVEPAPFGASDQSGFEADVPWTFSAREELGKACLRFHADLPPERAMDRDAERLSSSLNCQPLDSLEAGEMGMLVFTQIPGADLTFGSGLALVDKAELKGVFADGHTVAFPVINGSFVLVYQTAQDMQRLDLRAGGKVIKTCHPQDVRRHC